MENSDKAFTNWFVLMSAVHATAVIGLAMVEQLERKPKAKQEPARVSIQLVRAVSPPQKLIFRMHAVTTLFQGATGVSGTGCTLWGMLFGPPAS